MNESELRERIGNDILVAFDGFLQRQRSYQGTRRLSDESLEGLEVAKDALQDIVEGRMR